MTLKDNTHPSHNLCILLLSGERYRSICCRTTRSKDSFYHRAVRFLNLSIAPKCKERVSHSSNRLRSTNSTVTSDYFLPMFCTDHGSSIRIVSLRLQLDVWLCLYLFAEDAGTYFPSVKRDPGRYLQPCSDSVKTWLRSMKNAGKVLLLITSSHSDYCRLICEHILG